MFPTFGIYSLHDVFRINQIALKVVIRPDLGVAKCTVYLVSRNKFDLGR